MPTASMLRRATLAALGVALAHGCGNPSGLAGPLDAQLAVAPSFPSAHAGLVDVDRIRIVLERLEPRELALDTVVDIAEGADSVDLTIRVRITGSSEAFALTLALIAPAGDTVFRGGPTTVTATSGGAPQPVPVALTYTGVGANAADVVIVTPDTSVDFGGTVELSAVALDSGGAQIDGTPIGWSSLDPARATVPDETTGIVAGGTQRGIARIVAALLTGQKDTAGVQVLPVPSAITVVSGDGQTGLVDFPLGDPLVVRVLADDGLGVEAVGVTFTTPDGGTLSPDSLGTDASGDALTVWTLGPGLGTQMATATVVGFPELVVNVSATAHGTLAFTTVAAAGAVPDEEFLGSGHSCAIATDAVTYCWGDNTWGQLGNGGRIGSAVPVAVSGAFEFLMLGVQARHSCGLEVSGAVYCWGDYGTDSSNVPVVVVSDPPFSQMTVGGAHICGLTAEGLAYCWGGNGRGQLGDGTFTDSPTPVPVTGGLTFASIDAGGSVTCGVTLTGEGYCWGFGAFGNLGNGSQPDRESDPQLVSGGLTFLSISAGSGHTCGVTSAGPMYCWGINLAGELGDGTNTNSAVPVPVSGGLAFAAVSVSRGGRARYSCGVTTAGEGYCWGVNANGEQGNGSSSGSNVPVPVVGDLTFTSISANSSDGAHTCGLTQTGGAYCWGNNITGQLGNDTFVSSLVPVLVSGSVP